MRVSGADDLRLASSGVDALDEGGDFFSSPLLKKALSVLKPETLGSLDAARCNTWKVEVENQGLVQSSAWSTVRRFLNKHGCSEPGLYTVTDVDWLVVVSRYLPRVIKWFQFEASKNTHFRTLNLHNSNFLSRNKDTGTKGALWKNCKISKDGPCDFCYVQNPEERAAAPSAPSAPPPKSAPVF